MGIGLILAGVGKGIADAGTAYGAGVAKGAEMEWKQLEEERSYQRKLDMEDKRAETLKQRVISEIQAVNEKAKQIAADREDAQLGVDANKIAGVASNVKGASPAASADEIKQLMKDHPEYRETYAKAGLIEKPMSMSADKRAIQGAQDKVDAALAIGAHSSVIETFQKSKESLLKEIRDENKERNERERLDQNDRRLDILDKRVTSQNNTDNIKANKPSGKPDAGDKPPTGIDLERNAKAAKQALALELGVTDKDVAEKVAQLKKKGALSASVQEKLDTYNAALSNWQNYKSNRPSANRSSDNADTRPALDSFRR